MTKDFFERQTGLYPSADLWAAVIGYYTAHSGQYRSPAHFCRAYRRNARGLASEIQVAADVGAGVRAMLAGAV